MGLLKSAILGGSTPDFQQVGLDIGKNIKQLMADNKETGILIFLERLGDDLAAQVEGLLKKTGPGKRFIPAIQGALSGPREGPGTFFKRVETLQRLLQEGR